MNPVHPVVAAALLMLAPSLAGAAPSFHERVVATYSFAPHTLDNAGRAAKSAELDAFWSDAKAGGPTTVAALREELARADSPAFFDYDGAKLLLSLSSTQPDKTLALTAIARTDLEDVQRLDYFLTVHALAVDGLDTSAAAFKILGDDGFHVYIAAHSLTLDQEMCLLYLLMPTDESFYRASAERRLLTEEKVVAQKSLLTLLASTVTKDGDAAVARFADDSTKSDAARAYAKLIIDSSKTMAGVPLFSWTFKSYPGLKKRQRELFGRVSDEALYEWERLRLKLRGRGAP